MQHPWVGPHFSSSQNRFNGKKILVVGESHYTEAADIGRTIPDITLEVVTKYKSGEYNIPFFTKIITVLTGKPAQETGYEGVREAWDHLAFYNYIPVIVASGPREFDHTLWGRGDDEFKQVIRQLSPDLILVLGNRLWENAFHRQTDGKVAPSDHATHEVRTISENGIIPTVKIPHPSWPGFSGLQFHEKVAHCLS